jgi:hypothetical protein
LLSISACAPTLRKKALVLLTDFWVLPDVSAAGEEQALVALALPHVVGRCELIPG